MNKVYIPVALRRATEEAMKNIEEEKKNAEYQKFNKESEIWNSFK